MKDKCLDQIKKGSLIQFKLPKKHNSEYAKKVLDNFHELFGKYGIVISDKYLSDDEKLVVDVWLPVDIVFYAIPIKKLKFL